MTGKNPRSVRWQKIAIDQLGYALNLILTLTIAALGYCFILLRDGEVTLGCSARLLMLLSLSALGISAICGLLCVFNRLRDFRGTARRAASDREAPTKDELRSLGQITWLLFYVHLSTFALGVLALAMALLLTYGGKLA